LYRSQVLRRRFLIKSGTGIIVTEDAALAPGDEVSIEVAEIGRLSNHAALVE
jgi:2-keto-4-pentenoate hydratase/2-oxohepta-3-ene-1,7-dioic acid hydratase in catechol pathway